MDLLSRLKPEFSKVLFENAENYPQAVKSIENILSDQQVYSELQACQIMSLMTFIDVNIYDITPVDLLYGNKFFFSLEEWKKISDK